MTELSQKNENNIFITQWNQLNIFVIIEGIKTHHILKSGRKSNWMKHFTFRGRTGSDAAAQRSSPLE